MQEMEELNILRDEAKKEIENASSLAELEETETKYLGRKGLLTGQLRKIGSLPKELKKDFGQAVNNIKAELTEILAEKKADALSLETKKKYEAEAVDVTMPGRFYTPDIPILSTIPFLK